MLVLSLCELTYAHVDLVLLVGVHAGQCLAVGLERVEVDVNVWSFARGREMEIELCFDRCAQFEFLWQVLAVVEFRFEVRGIRGGLLVLMLVCVCQKRKRVK